MSGCARGPSVEESLVRRLIYVYCMYMISICGLCGILVKRARITELEQSKAGGGDASKGEDQNQHLY